MQDIQLFINSCEIKVAELTRKANLSYFNASISGKEEDYKEAADLQLALNKIYSDKDDFKLISEFKSRNINDQFLKRQVGLLFNSYAINQYHENLHERIVKLSTKIESDYSTFRASVDGKELTDNQIDSILEESLDSDVLKKTWEASKQVGKQVEKDVIELVKLRNEAARENGYKNFHEMSLVLNEQNTEQVDEIFDELDRLTRDEFSGLKTEIDNYLSERYGITQEELMPWHYMDKYFQQGPKIYSVDYDKFFAEADPAEITAKYFAGIDLPVEDIINNSDLYEKPNKYQHAYCSDIDRAGDIRVVCNLKRNYKWIATMLHEFGHAVYDKYINRKLPWLLRTHSHILTTEAIAMLFGRMASNPAWIKSVLGINSGEIDKIKKSIFNSLRLEQLVFCRWTQVIYRFEKELFSNPDQDLNSLWWSLVEKYQFIKKPDGRNEPDWAAKIHIALYPVYYHNYMLGELLASQLNNYITTRVIAGNSDIDSSYCDIKEVGAYLKHLFFNYGALYAWNDLIYKSTGENLNPKYYVDQFVHQSFHEGIS
ncbi:MAG: M2 family metallopeptidase [Melioribacteraceae bacterium]|nr:M2 family metallopeptidase [Melioribacteraceae bacterium]